MWVVLGDDNEVIMYLAHGEVIVGRSSHREGWQRKRGGSNQSACRPAPASGPFQRPAESKLVLVREDVSRMHAKLFVDSLASDGVGVVSVEDASKVGVSGSSRACARFGAVICTPFG